MHSNPNHPVVRALRAVLVTGVIAGVAIAGIANADSHAASEQEVSPELKYRQTLMEAIGSNMGAIGTILKNGLDRPGAIANHAGQMADSAALIAAAFKKQEVTGPTDAKKKIWKDWAKFESAIADFEKASRGLESAANGGDAKATGLAVRALGKSCGGCHKPFRKPKEESFKNR